MNKNKNKLIKIIPIICFVLFSGIIFLLPNFCSAQVDVGLEFAEETGLAETDIRIVIARIIRVVIGILGIIAVGIIVYGGYIWMTSRGIEERVTRAKKILLNGVIGLIIAVLAFTITQFILNRLMEAVGITPFTAEEDVSYDSALGGGIIEMHYPPRNALGIPRNTKIIVTFKEPMMISTMADEDGNVVKENVQIFRSFDEQTVDNFIDASVRYTDDLKTFVFIPDEWLGSPTEEVSYAVFLGTGIKKQNGGDAFRLNPYIWKFQVSTELDFTPPQVKVSNPVWPIPGDEVARNTSIVVSFNEAIDPTAIKNVEIINETDRQKIEGKYYIANQYKTIEFISDGACEKDDGTVIEENACGQPVFCLPPEKEIRVLVRAATVTDPADSYQAEFDNGYDGIIDVASNSLDGNRDSSDGSVDGRVVGPQSQSGFSPYSENEKIQQSRGDDYEWIFRTTRGFDVTPPEIVDHMPGVDQENVSVLSSIGIDFNEPISPRTVTTDNILLRSGGDIFSWYMVDQPEFERVEIPYRPDEDPARVYHKIFDEETGYSVEVTSDINDMFFNCFVPCRGPAGVFEGSYTF